MKDEIYAVPGEHNIIDEINPNTGLTCVFGHTEAQVLARDPKAVRMLWKDWAAWKATTQNTPITWAPCTPAKYHEMLGVLPPARWRGGMFLVGEPMDHSISTGQPRYSAYWHRNGFFFVASRPLTSAEFDLELNQKGKA